MKTNDTNTSTATATATLNEYRFVSGGFVKLWDNGDRRTYGKVVEGKPVAPDGDMIILTPERAARYGSQLQLIGPAPGATGEGHPDSVYGGSGRPSIAAGEAAEVRVETEAQVETGAESEAVVETEAEEDGEGEGEEEADNQLSHAEIIHGSKAAKAIRAIIGIEKADVDVLAELHSLEAVRRPPRPTVIRAINTRLEELGMELELE